MTVYIGVAITTHNRPEIRERCLEQWATHLRPGAFLALVDDASEPPAKPTMRVDTFHRFDRNVGIATAKNKSIELLMDAGVDHLFLSDDDTWPICDDWWQPYVDAPTQHAMLYNAKTVIDGRDDHVKWSNRHSSGHLLYATRAVIDRVGGMHTEYPRWGGEHTEWSRRIHNAGLTPRRYLDVVNSDELLHTADSFDEVESTTSLAERESTRIQRKKLHARFAGTAGFVPYRKG